MSDPLRPDIPRAKWSGPEKRVKAYLRQRGFQVVRAGQPFAGWHLVALHPFEALRLLWVHPPHGPEPDMAALVAFPCNSGYIREVWRYPRHALRPVVAQVNGGPTSRGDR